MISGRITVKIYMRKMNRKTLPPPLNDAPGMKARSYSLALCDFDVGAWRRHRFGCGSLMQLSEVRTSAVVLSYVWICAVYLG